jgi:transposase
MEAISGRKMIQVSQWKRQLLDGASELFTCGKKSENKEEGQAKEAELFQQIGRLQMELQWLKKVSAALRPMNCEAGRSRPPCSASAVCVRC